MHNEHFEMWSIYYLKILFVTEIRSLTFYGHYSQAKYLGWSPFIMAFCYISLKRNKQNPFPYQLLETNLQFMGLGKTRTSKCWWIKQLLICFLLSGSESVLLKEIELTY